MEFRNYQGFGLFGVALAVPLVGIALLVFNNYAAAVRLESAG